MFMNPKVRANAGTVPGAAKINIMAEQKKGAPKWVIPYGSQARTSNTVCLWADKMLDKLAPYKMFSSAGSTRTQMGGLNSAGMNLVMSM